VFDAKSNVLVPPVNPRWITSIVKEAFNRKEGLGMTLRNKKLIYGQPGQVSKLIVRTMKKEFEDGNPNFYPWLHQRINLWKEKQGLDHYM
jgi:hypothetical protein